MPVLNAIALIENRVTALRAAHDHAGTKKAELDLSGGIDSAVMAGLLVEALGPENVVLVHSRFKTNPEQTSRAQNLSDALNCPLIDVDLSGFYDSLVSVMKDAIGQAHGEERLNQVSSLCDLDRTVLGSIRSTLRAPIGRAFNRLMGGGLRHGTGNECEDRFLRFYQKGGDGEVDSNPIAMLSKAETYQLAFALGQRLGCLPSFQTIIRAVPSPDLWGNGDEHSDEAELLKWTGVPFTYGRINADTGEITSVGTIERVARFADLSIGQGVSAGDLLFSDFLTDRGLEAVLGHAVGSAPFQGVTETLTRKLLLAARRCEKVTRHKLNPNCPTYGTRAEMKAAGILTDDLPVI